ncbi:hypothetical protein [Streptomyces sp. NPDC016675]|uniref:hypothetical protein n=1 Tax=Streptomyces sp. NPDC016675 TaxID=3364970 RepID=UPI0036FFCFFA
MASTHLTPAERAARDARARQLATEGLSNRAIGRELGIHHVTVANILRAAPTPVVNTTPATSGDTRAPRLLHDLDPRTIQDLNCLMDPTTGELPAPLVRAIRAAADARRTTLRAIARRFADEERTAETGRAPVRAQVAP